MDEETLYQLILRWLAQGGGPRPPAMLVETPWGPVEVVDDTTVAPIYEDTATVGGYGGGNPDAYLAANAYQNIGGDELGRWNPPGPMTGMTEPWFDYDPYAGGEIYDAFGGTTTGEMRGSPIGVYTGPLMDEERKANPRTDTEPALGRGIEAIVQAANALAATQRNTMPTLGRGLAEAMQASVPQQRTVRADRSAPATQRNTYTPVAAPVYQPVAQRPAAQQITHYATAPVYRPSPLATSLRASLPGLATARNTLRR